MATWMTHIRIADLVLKQFDLDANYFIVGSIAPDSGVKNETDSGFIPPKEITHWKNSKISALRFDQIDTELFLNQVIMPNLNEDLEKRSFCFGYYCHLLTDIKWHQFVMDKVKRIADFKLSAFKEEVQCLDYDYLKEINNAFKTRFRNVYYNTDYLDYLSIDFISNHIQQVKEFYNNPKKLKSEDHVFIVQKELEDFVLDTTSTLVIELLNYLEVKNG